MTVVILKYNFKMQINLKMHFFFGKGVIYEQIIKWAKNSNFSLESNQITLDQSLRQKQLFNLFY